MFMAKNEIVPVDVFNTDKKEEPQALVPYAPKNEIQVLDGYYDGSKSFRDALVEAEEKEKKNAEKDRSIVYISLIIISMILLIFGPSIKNYVNLVNEDVGKDIERMPYIIGLNESEAKNLLSGHQVTVEYIDSDNPLYEDGLVMKANVDYGVPLNKTQDIKLYVVRNSSAPAKIMEKVTFPKFPIEKNNFIVQSGILENGEITLSILNRNEKRISEFLITIEQYNDIGEQINNRTFCYNNLNLKYGQVFTIKFKLTNPNTVRFGIAGIEIIQ